MTWIRLDTDFADHKLVGDLAEALRMHPDRAAMSLIRVWLKLAEHCPDGQVNHLTSTTLENWAKWHGLKGRFFEVFRAQCVDEDGMVRGWWRQVKLLEHQRLKRSRPNQKTRAKALEQDTGPAEIRRESGESPAPDYRPKSAGNEDEDEDVNGTTSSSVGRTRATARLLGRLTTDAQRVATVALLQAIPENQNPDSWADAMTGYLDGLGIQGGKATTPDELATACLEYRGIPNAKYSPAHFRATVDRVVGRRDKALSRRPPPDREARIAGAIDTFLARGADD